MISIYMAGDIYIFFNFFLGGGVKISGEDPTLVRNEEKNNNIYMLGRHTI